MGASPIHAMRLLQPGVVVYRKTAWTIVTVVKYFHVSFFAMFRLPVLPDFTRL